MEFWKIREQRHMTPIQFEITQCPIIDKTKRGYYILMKEEEPRSTVWVDRKGFGRDKRKRLVYPSRQEAVEMVQARIRRRITRFKDGLQREETSLSIINQIKLNIESEAT